MGQTGRYTSSHSAPPNRNARSGRSVRSARKRAKRRVYALVAFILFFGLAVIFAYKPASAATKTLLQSFRVAEEQAPAPAVEAPVESIVQFQPAVDAPADAAQGRWALFRSGFTVAATNPSALIFLSALLPQFVRAEAPLWPQFLILATTFSACALVAHATYVAAARQVAPWLAPEAGRRRFRCASGAAFVFMGVGLIAARGG